MTVNHRLGVFGYCFLGDAAPGFEPSGNVGMLDLVQALQWTHDNIATFGGDPANVTIFGLSGGGLKVSHLMAMPSAKGLFHKAIIMSGPGVRAVPRENAAQLSQALMTKLGVGSDVNALQAVAPADLLAAATAVTPRVGPGTYRMFFAPVVDGVVLPRHPFDPTAPDISADIPLIVGHAHDEITTFLVGDPNFGNYTEAQLRQGVAPVVGEDRADAVIAAYRSVYPHDNPSYLLVDILTDHGAGADSTRIAERKVRQGRALAWRYLVTWKSPALGGRLWAGHGIDGALVFDNVEIARSGMYGPGPDPQRLADAVCGAFVAFARNGRPDGTASPPWPAYTLERRETMVFDVPPRVVNDPQKVQRLLWSDAGH